jgi:hypothetical protein
MGLLKADTPALTLSGIGAVAVIETPAPTAAVSDRAPVPYGNEDRTPLAVVDVLVLPVGTWEGIITLLPTLGDTPEVGFPMKVLPVLPAAATPLVPLTSIGVVVVPLPPLKPCKGLALVPAGPCAAMAAE